ncbi:hypothetical protein BBJ28_00004393 [Nothophytophthora sp. Chile5]|nr:hypothetical protein BBJ28_00004393 [Nothophytophthora sp. Chile5]
MWISAMLIFQIMKTSLKRYRLTGKVWMPPTDSAAVFDELSVGMDDTFAGLSSFFKTLEIDELPCPGRRNSTANSVAQGMHVEFLDTYALPFDFHQADRAIWTLGADGLEDLTAVFAEVRVIATI